MPDSRTVVYVSSAGSREVRVLSLDRANAVKDLLMKGGVEESRMTTQGFGQDNPIASNDTEEGKARNRRLELVVEKR